MGRQASLPVVAVVGRPNVGKSSLVNRILGRREAIVQETPGVTRDRRAFLAEWNGRLFELFDTGGLEPGARGLDERVVEQAQVAIEAADVIVLVVDSVVGLVEDDVLVADQLRKGDKPVLVVANKVDDARSAPAAAEFYKLGLGDPQPVSALHGTGSGDFLDALVAALPETDGTPSDEWASIAIVGRPNVGKSSILNRLAGEARSIVDSTPGTTRDPIDTIIEADGRRLRLVDTAGLRRQVQIDDPIEYFSWLRSRRTLQRADAAIIVVDVAEGVTGHDQRIAKEVVEAGRCCVIAMNKWDLTGGEESDLRRLEADARTRLRFVPWAPVVRTSAVTGRGVGKLLPSVERAVDSHRRRLPTALVNRYVQDAQVARPHPRSGGRSIKVLYATQPGVSPPSIVLFSNGRLEESYVRYLENRLREHEPFEGTPLRLQVRVKSRDTVKS